MKLHKRFYVVEKASEEMKEAYRKIVKKYDLTYGEGQKIFAELLASDAKYVIREERHPGDPDKKGDEA